MTGRHSSITPHPPDWKKKEVARCTDCVLQPPGIEPGSVLHRNEASPSVRHSACEFCGRHERNDESRLSTSGWSTYLLRTARVSRERVVDDVRRQEFSNILGYPTCDRSAHAILQRRVPCLCWQAGILPLDHGCPMYGRVFQMRRKGIAMSMSLVCAPLSSVMGRMGFSFGCGEQSTRSTPLSDAEQRNETQRTMGC